MIDVQQLLERLLACGSGDEPIELLEEWIDLHSWDAHHHHDPVTASTVFRLESLYTAYIEGRLRRDSLLEAIGELASMLSRHLLSDGEREAALPRPPLMTSR